MCKPLEPLMDDGFDGEPAKRVLRYVEEHKKRGNPIAGIYCGYAPIELIQAMGIVPAVLCAFSKVPIESRRDRTTGKSVSFDQIQLRIYPGGNMPVFLLVSSCDCRDDL